MLVSLVCDLHGQGGVIWFLFGFGGSYLARQRWGFPLCAQPCLTSGLSLPVLPLKPCGKLKPLLEGCGCPGSFYLWVSDCASLSALAPCPGAAGAVLPLLVGARLWWERPRVPPHVQCGCWPCSSLLLVPWL